MAVLQAMGDTSMVRLRQIVPPVSGEALVELARENPAGSSVASACRSTTRGRPGREAAGMQPLVKLVMPAGRRP